MVMQSGVGHVIMYHTMRGQDYSATLSNVTKELQ